LILLSVLFATGEIAAKYSQIKAWRIIRKYEKEIPKMGMMQMALIIPFMAFLYYVRADGDLVNWVIMMCMMSMVALLYKISVILENMYLMMQMQYAALQWIVSACCNKCIGIARLIKIGSQQGI